MKINSFCNCKYIEYFSKNNLIGVFCVIFITFGHHFATAQRLSATYLQYIEQYKEIAIDQQREYGIPASITLAQGLLESAAGTSYLARKGNNHFGIKCHSQWKGEVIEVGDTARRVCYRQYGSARESFDDHARFLQTKRYRRLYDLEVTDYKGWAAGLRECGYAEDTAYPQKLIGIIEQYELYNYDSEHPLTASTGKRDKQDKRDKQTKQDKRTKHNSTEAIDHDLRSNESQSKEVLKKVTSLHSVKRKWKLHYVVAEAGDTYHSIASEFNLKTQKLLDFNDIDEANEPLQPGMKLYLEKKASRTPEGFDTYTIRHGDTPWRIAQEFGIKLSTLLKINGIRRDTTLHPGDTIQLR